MCCPPATAQRHLLRILLTGLLLATAPLRAAAVDPADLPPPADWTRFQSDTTGEDIGLPLGATGAYALGRSLLQRGDSEAGLMYLSRAYRLAPESWLITETFARGLGEAGYVHDAARLFAELVAMAPDSSAQRRQYALLLAQTGRPQEALAQIGELQLRQELDLELVKLKADLLGRIGQIDAALTIYRQAARSDPPLAEDYYLAAGALLEREQRPDEKAGLLREGLDLVPTSRALTQNLMRDLLNRQKLAEAQELAAQVDRRRRDAGLTQQPECGLDLAEILRRQGKIAEAGEVLEGLRESGQRYQVVETWLARIYLAGGRAHEASAILAAASALWPEAAELKFLQGRSLEMQGERGEACRLLREAIALEPDVTAYRISLLRLFILHSEQMPAPQGDPDLSQSLRDEMRDHAIRAEASVAPQDSNAHLILGHAFRQLDDLTRACRHFHLAGEASETRVTAWLELSACLEQSGQAAEALRVLEILQAEFPDDPEVANNLGYLLAEQGQDLLRAEQLVRQALRSDPQNGAYLDSLGWVFFQRSDFEAALHWLVEAVNQRPDDPAVLEHLGRTLHRLGEPKKALDILHRALSLGGDAARLRALIAEVEGGR